MLENTGADASMKRLSGSDALIHTFDRGASSSVSPARSHQSAVSPSMVSHTVPRHTVRV